MDCCLLALLGLFRLAESSCLCLDSFTLRLHASLAGLALGLEIHHLTAVVKAAVEAHVVWAVEAATVLAHSHFRRGERVV